MKYIFDFDDVLVATTNGFREAIYTYLEKLGITRDRAKQYIEQERLNQFSLKKMLGYFFLEESLYYDDIMDMNKNFVNRELIELVKKLGKENCFIVTYGDKDFQMDKIRKAGIDDLVSEIFVVQGSKKEAVENICAKYNHETVTFIDDKDHHFKDLDFQKYPNLKTILYTGQKLEFDTKA